MRVAIAQFATTLNTQENLATCLRMINSAAVCEPAIIVLPEYGNSLFYHGQPCYVDHNQAWDEAVSMNGIFIQQVAEQAKIHHCYIVLNVTVRRDLLREHQDGTVKSNISVTSCLFSPLGALIHQVDKQRLVGHEDYFFIGASKVSKAISTPVGTVGLLMGSDVISFKKSGDLALSGAQLLCHSMNTFALDQSHFHDPASACENKVFIATANKIGPLMPDEQSAIFSQQKSIPQHSLVGVGHSQIVAANGQVLAKLSHQDEAVAFADIDVDDTINKCRPDGTELFTQRRPELYQSLPVKPASQGVSGANVPKTANVAIFATYTTNEQAIEDVCFYIENNLSDIIQLPELFFVADKTITNDAEQLSQIALLSKQVISRISAVLRPFQYVCTSVVMEGRHQAVLISEQGLLATQAQLHFCQRYQWTALGDELNIIELALEQGNLKLAMLTGDDANMPELVNVAALQGIHLLLVPFDIQEPCEVEYKLLSRAVEHSICILAATREKSFACHVSSDNANSVNKPKLKTKKSTGLIINLTTDSALLPQWQAPIFKGYINQPRVKHQHGKITKAVIHPIAAGT